MTMIIGGAVVTVATVTTVTLSVMTATNTMVTSTTGKLTGDKPDTTIIRGTAKDNGAAATKVMGGYNGQKIPTKE